MARGATLVVKIISDTSKAAGDVDKVASKYDKFKTGMGKLAVPAGIATAAIAAFGKQVFDSASRTQQAMGAVDTVFGKSADQVKRWATNAADAVGLSKAEYGELASKIGASLKNLGVPLDQVAGKTNDLVKVGADLAATYGGTTAEAVDALGAVLRGETDPIERYGISIKQATIAAEMHKEGTDKLTGSAATAAKTQATLNLITKQAGPAMGAFAREADTAAGQQQRMAANVENMKSALGQGLLPVVAKFATVLGGVAKWVEKNSTLVAILVGILGGLAVAVLAVNAALKVYEATLLVIKAVQTATFLTNPIFLVVAAIVALVAIIVIAYKKSETFRRIVDGAFRAVKDAAAAAWNWIKSHWKLIAVIVGGPMVAAALLVIRHWDKIKAKVKAVLDWMKTAVRAAVDVIKSQWQAIKDKSAQVWDAIKTKIRAVVDAIKTIIGGIRDKAHDVFTAVSTAWTSLVKKLHLPAGLEKLLTDPFAAMNRVVGDVKGAIDALVRALAGIHFPNVKVPGWVNKIIPGAAYIPGSPVVAAAARATPAARGSAGAGAGGGGGPTIIVQGAIDPEATARQIRRILENHDRRIGLRVS